MQLRVSAVVLELWGIECLGLVSVVGPVVPVTMCDSSCQFRAGCRNTCAVTSALLEKHVNWMKVDFFNYGRQARQRAYFGTPGKGKKFSGHQLTARSFRLTTAQPVL